MFGNLIDYFKMLLRLLIQFICLVPSFAYFVFIKCLIFLHLVKSTDTESVPNSTVEDGPGDGFTILSAKSLFLGQKVKHILHLLKGIDGSM